MIGGIHGHLRRFPKDGRASNGKHPAKMERKKSSGKNGVGMTLKLAVYLLGSRNRCVCSAGPVAARWYLLQLWQPTQSSAPKSSSTTAADCNITLRAMHAIRLAWLLDTHNFCVLRIQIIARS